MALKINIPKRCDFCGHKLVKNDKGEYECKNKNCIKYVPDNSK